MTGIVCSVHILVLLCLVDRSIVVLLEKFSIVLPIKDEVELFRRTFPYMLNLGADEILICLDDPPDRELDDCIRNTQRKLETHSSGGGRATTDVKVLCVERDPAWGFHQAHVRRAGYEEAKHDTLFTLDVDVVVRPSVLKGLEYIGKNNIALVSFNKLLNLKGPIRFFRSVEHQVRSRILGSKGFTGLYWLYRPWYYELMPEKIVRAIGNGEDTLLLYQLSRQQKYDRVHFPEIGAYCLTANNEDLVWRQFERGVWLAIWGRKGRLLTNTQHIALRAFMSGHPHLLRGYLWAKRNNIKVPRDYYEYQMYQGPKWKTLLSTEEGK